MVEEIYVDLDILGDTEDSYLVNISKDALNSLVTFDEGLVIRHWDGGKPVVLKPYGDDSVRTQEDGSEDNNLGTLPNIDVGPLLAWINSQ